MELSAHIKAELAATCSTLGRNFRGQYVIDPDCYESIRLIIRFIRRDDAYHHVRNYLGDAKILQNDLVPIASITPHNTDLFDIVIRLMVILTNPVILLYREEIPTEKIGHNIYLRLIGYSQEYKTAFCNVEFWKVVGEKLTEIFEIDWSERSEDSSLQVERLLVLLRNVLQVPADYDVEHRPDNDVTIHDKVLWALRESNLLEILLYVSSNRYEEKYFLHLVEIFSLILREQNPVALARSDIGRSFLEKEKDAKELSLLRSNEKSNAKNFKNVRSFTPTFVLKNVKSISQNEVVYHKSLDKMTNLRLTQDKKRIKTPKNKFPEDSERAERRSTFSVRLFLKEFCMELLSCSFNHLMGIVKDKLVSGRGLTNDESYYFWALRFFLEFSCAANIDIKLISECINVQTFHFVQTQIENCYDRITTDKKKFALWIKRLHLTLKAYRSLLQTLIWMDSSPDQKIREISKVLKSNIFYVVEYRELMLSCLNKYNPGQYPLSFLRDLIETNHLNLKLLENYCKTSRIVVQKKKKLIKRPRKNKENDNMEISASVETPEAKWDKIKDAAFDLIEKNIDIPEIPPFDAAADVPIDEQKETAMKNIQKYLRNGETREAIGLLRSARQVWPENDAFGSSDISLENEVMALQEICLTDLGVPDEVPPPEEDSQDEEEEENNEPEMQVIDIDFDINDYIKKLANKKIVEGCCILLANFKRNTSNTNHCVVKLLHRIGWECKVPAMMYQASFFITLQKILQDKSSEYKEIQQFAKHLMKKFRENAKSNPRIFVELLFWKESKIAIDIECGYGASEEKKHKGVWSEEEEDELKRLWEEFDEKMLDGDKIDWINNNLINQSRSRLSIIKKLKDLMLIMPGTRVAKSKSGKADWSNDETEQLTKLYEELKDAVDPVELIRGRLTIKRSKKSIKDKILELGLVSDLIFLKKKRLRKPGKSKMNEVDDGRPPPPSSSSSSDEDESVEVPYSRNNAIVALLAVNHMKPALEWLKETFEECLEEEDNSEGYPLLPLDSNHAKALDYSGFLELLRKLQVAEPLGTQVYWKIPNISKIELHDRMELIKSAINDTLEPPPVVERSRRISEDSGSEDEFEKLRRTLPNRTSEPIGNGTPKPIDSDRSDMGEASDENYGKISGRKKVRKIRTKKTQASIGSDRSDLGDESGEDMPKGKQRKNHRRMVDSGDELRNGTIGSGSDRSDKGAGSEEESRDANRQNGFNVSENGVGQKKKNFKRIGSVDSGDERNNGGIGSDRSDKGGQSDDESRNASTQNHDFLLSENGVGQKKKNFKRIGIVDSDDERNNGAIGSDRSDKGGQSEEESRNGRRPGFLLSDSEGEAAPVSEMWKQKRRRYVGSDSEVEDNPSDSELSGRPLEVRKRCRMLDSGSE